MKKIIIKIVIVILIFLSGFIIGQQSALHRGYLKGQDQAKKECQERIKELFPDSSEEVKEVLSIFGEILEVRENDLLVETVFHPTTPLEEAKIETKTVKINNDTIFLEEIREFQEVPLPESPETYKQVAILFSDLKIGDEIFIESEENIREKDEFFAKKIILQSISPEE